jgi:hypothetical protein
LAFEPSGAVWSAATHRFVRQGRAGIPEEAQHVERARQRVGHHTACDHRSNTVERVSSDAAMPKLPPPPRIAQNRSGFVSALAEPRCRQP